MVRARGQGPVHAAPGGGVVQPDGGCRLAARGKGSADVFRSLRCQQVRLRVLRRLHSDSSRGDAAIRSIARFHEPVPWPLPLCHGLLRYGPRDLRQSGGRGVDRVPRRRHPAPRPHTHALHAARFAGRGRAQGREGVPAHHHADDQQHPDERRTLIPGRPRDGAPGLQPRPLERGGHGQRWQQARHGCGWAHRHLRLHLRRLGGRHEPLLQRQGLRWRPGRPDLHAGARLSWSVCPRVPRGPPQPRADHELPPRGRRQGRVELPAPSAHARLLGEPHGLHGNRPALRGHAGPLLSLLAPPWHGRHLRVPRLVLHRRRRDGRAGVHLRHCQGGLREAEQFDHDRELQLPALGWACPREFQGHPGV
mmetsp:Transcript_50948/g.163502  ORF Transcript_50948/g.163502 Transcript_50948/m.163502 type:complete len:364 (+) Transcript_50948:271-1362(+)